MPAVPYIVSLFAFRTSTWLLWKLLGKELVCWWQKAKLAASWRRRGAYGDIELAAAASWRR